MSLSVQSRGVAAFCQRVVSVVVNLQRYQPRAACHIACSWLRLTRLRDGTSLWRSKQTVSRGLM